MDVIIVIAGGSGPADMATGSEKLRGNQRKCRDKPVPACLSQAHLISENRDVQSDKRQRDYREAFCRIDVS